MKHYDIRLDATRRLEKTFIMNKQKIIDLLGRLENLKNEDQRINDKLHEYVRALSPASYTPIIENGMIAGAMAVLRELYHYELVDDIEYYLFEVPFLGKSAEIEYKGKQYNTKDISEYADYLVLRFAEYIKNGKSACKYKGNK